MILKENFNFCIKYSGYYHRDKQNIEKLNFDIYDIVKTFMIRNKNKPYLNLYDNVRINLQRFFYFDDKNYYEDIDIWEKVDDYFLENNLFNKKLKLTHENIKNIKQLSNHINKKIESIINDPFNFSGFDLPDKGDNEALEYNLHQSKFQYSENKKILTNGSHQAYLSEWKDGRVKENFDLPLWNKIIGENFYYQISNRLIDEISDYIEGYGLYIHELTESGHPKGTIYWFMNKSDSIKLIL